MVIDGHAHACGKYLNVDSIEKYLFEHRIDKVVLCGGEPNSCKDYSYPMLSTIFKGENLGYFFNKIICKVTKISHAATHIDEQNEAVYKLACELPEKVVNTYWVNPLEKNCVKKMDKLYPTYKFKMVKLHQCWTNFDINCNEYTEIIKWATIHNLPVFIHLLSENQVVKFVETANNSIDTTFIVAHMIGIDYMGRNLSNPNIFFDLSAPQLYSINILQRAINVFGAERLLLGSDTPYGKDNIEKVYQKLRQVKVSENEMKLICGKNLKLLLDL
ncbi:MAG: hypothetical protein CVV02_17660 [Firmicutes bacterium HGW-Firmicutes-7]|nr:MAG: hypothetical protein CVV02_17660 [Firmicutes bacterium HGW-Firmicutes-7]